MRAFLSVLALVLVLSPAVVKAEEYDAIDESSFEADADAFVPRETNMLVRLKSGVGFPAQNGEVNRLLPVTLDWSYTGYESFAIGAELTWATGSHGVQRVDLPTLQTAAFDLSKSMANVLTTADYRFQLGAARVLAGAKMGVSFYRESYAFAAGPVTFKPPGNSSQTAFMAGPSLNVDLPVKGPLFVNLSGDYLFSKNETQSGSLYAGLGADF